MNKFVRSFIKEFGQLPIFIICACFSALFVSFMTMHILYNDKLIEVFDKLTPFGLFVAFALISYFAICIFVFVVIGLYIFSKSVIYSHEDKMKEVKNE